MRLFVSVDYEGIWGVPSWEFMKTEEAKQLLHKELNVLLKSIEEVDANAYVLMVDSHSRGDNILPQHAGNQFCETGSHIWLPTAQLHDDRYR